MAVNEKEYRATVDEIFKVLREAMDIAMPFFAEHEINPLQAMHEIIIELGTKLSQQARALDALEKATPPTDSKNKKNWN